MPQKFQRLKKSRSLTKSSQKWLLRQINDPFVEKAKIEGWKSRAAFKIIEIDEKFKIFKKNKIIVDLGSAPGGWSQYSVQKVGENNVFAIDLLEMDKIAGVNFFIGDFNDCEISKKLIDALLKNPLNRHNLDNNFGLCDVIMSDMAANTSGDRKVDHLRIINLVEEALFFAEKFLKKDGVFIAKIFQGGNSDEILKKLRKNFSSVKYFKPNSSRKDSSETYLVALDFKRSEIDLAD